MNETLHGISINAESDSAFSFQLLQGEQTDPYYFFSNDVFCNRVWRSGYIKDAVYFGIANNHFLHVLAELINAGVTVKRVVATDLSRGQLTHLYNTCQGILKAGNRIEFLEIMLCVRFGSKAREILGMHNIHPSGYVHGSCPFDSFEAIEKALWENTDFDANAFKQKHNVDAVKTSHGLLLNFQQKNFGNLDSYYLSVLTGSERIYNKTAFTAAFGSGYLRDEDTFARMRETLRRVPVYLLLSNYVKMSHIVFGMFRYSPIIVWTSNLFSFNKFGFLFCNLAQRFKFGPNIKILGGLVKWLLGWYSKNVDILIYTDERKVRDRYFRRPVSLNVFVPKVFRNVKLNTYATTVHHDAFRVVMRHFSGGDNAHIVNNMDWILVDKGVPKLPNAKYFMVEDFARDPLPGPFGTILFHELLSNGLTIEDFKSLFDKAKRCARQVIVLEHNAFSCDFNASNIGVRVEDIRQYLGQEHCVEYSKGENCLDRNMILVYNTNASNV